MSTPVRVTVPHCEGQAGPLSDQLTSMFERRLVPPYGLHGGECGAPFRVTITRAGGCAEDMPGKASVRLDTGDLVTVESCGGGGYGAVAGKT